MSPCAAPVVCIGGLNIDRKLRLLAEALPASSNPCEAHETPGGVVRNVAENLARLGLPVALVAAAISSLLATMAAIAPASAQVPTG